MQNKQSLSHAGITGSGAGTPLRVLSAVLRSVAPELLDCPEVINQIATYLGFQPQKTNERLYAGKMQQLLEQHLHPPVNEKAHNLMITLDGMKTAMQEYGLHSGQELDAFTAYKKEEFGSFIFNAKQIPEPRKIGS